ncbi:MAG: hypothetical protein ACOC32_02750, partial [Nanoarchaeota archaeon]
MEDINRMAKLLRGGDEYFLRVPGALVKEQQLKENDFVVLEVRKAKTYVVEVDKVTLDEFERLKKLPQYREKDDGQILKELMFKFHHQDDK